MPNSENSLLVFVSIEIITVVFIAAFAFLSNHQNIIHLPYEVNLLFSEKVESKKEEIKTKDRGLLAFIIFIIFIFFIALVIKILYFQKKEIKSDIDISDGYYPDISNDMDKISLSNNNDDYDDDGISKSFLKNFFKNNSKKNVNKNNKASIPQEKNFEKYVDFKFDIFMKNKKLNIFYFKKKGEEEYKYKIKTISEIEKELSKKNNKESEIEKFLKIFLPELTSKIKLEEILEVFKNNMCLLKLIILIRALCFDEVKKNLDLSYFIQGLRNMEKSKKNEKIFAINEEEVEKNIGENVNIFLNYQKTATKDEDIVHNTKTAILIENLLEENKESHIYQIAEKSFEKFCQENFRFQYFFINEKDKKFIHERSMITFFVYKWIYEASKELLDMKKKYPVFCVRDTETGTFFVRHTIFKSLECLKNLSKLYQKNQREFY